MYLENKLTDATLLPKTKGKQFSCMFKLQQKLLQECQGEISLKKFTSILSNYYELPSTVNSR